MERILGQGGQIRHDVAAGGTGGGETGGARPRILAVDDHDQNLELLEAFLEELGGATLLASNGADALKLVAEQRPDLILLDVMMPRMSGWQVCSKLKSSAETAGIPVVMVTALNEVADMEHADECGADDFLSKPVVKADLLAKVRTLLAAGPSTKRARR